jgi:hypothetical protein
MLSALIALLIAGYHSGVNNPNLCDPSEKTVTSGVNNPNLYDPSEKAVTKVGVGMHAGKEKSVPRIRNGECEPLDFDCVIEEYERI